ncbi:uncharacterized protein [Diadema setosum]|uniref:uncharacterized protein n=1 Tax=Diadema setosum TaxID=31175 RepID=UPI003B3ACC91
MAAPLSISRRSSEAARSAVAESQLSRPYSDATWMTRSGTHPMGKGQILFTGPSGIRDYKVNVVTDDRMVGIGTMSPEGTSALQYIWRGAPGSAPPQRRATWVGEIGWFIPPFHDYKNTTSGNQIQLRVFRKAQEEKYTHRFQEPWYPNPNDSSYKTMFPFTQGSKATWRPSGTQQPMSRPHTVASFHRNSQLPNLANSNNNATTERPTSAHPSSANSDSAPSRPVSGHLHRGYSEPQHRPPSLSSTNYTPPGSRPGSGQYNTVQYNNRSPSAHSRTSVHSSQSRGSSTSHFRRAPAATRVSSGYRAPMSDPEY